jgi:hypothetical protein
MEAEWCVTEPGLLKGPRLGDSAPNFTSICF